MWRALVAALVLANVVYFAWSQGALIAFGTQPARFADTEPHRLAQQVRPDVLQIRKEPPRPAASAASTPPAPPASAPIPVIPATQ